MRERLESYGRVRGLAFGQYGEWSTDVTELLDVCADALAQRRWRAMGARTPSEAFIVASLRRKLGLVATRELARLRLGRLPLVGVDAALLHAGARLARAQWRSTHGSADEPLGRPPNVVDEDFHAYQARAVLV